MRGNFIVVVQLGGLEPPTSCSTDRRSNQLSYNCILRLLPSDRGRLTGRKLGATQDFGKAKSETRARQERDKSTAVCAPFAPNSKARATARPGLSSQRASADQAAGL